MRDSKRLVLAIMAVVLLVVLAAPQFAHAGTITELKDAVSCGAIGGTWTAAAKTCAVNGFTVAAGDTLQVDAGITLTNSGTATNSGTLNNLGTLTNSGTLDNFGVVGNTGLITNSKTGTIENMNNGVVTNNAGAALTNDGGMIENRLGGTVNNAGTLNNNDAGTVTNTGVLNNYNALNNNAALTNSGSLNNGGTVANNPGGSITNTGGLINYNTINNGGTINNSVAGADITNYGVINNGATIANAGTVTNACQGTISPPIRAAMQPCANPAITTPNGTTFDTQTPTISGTSDPNAMVRLMEGKNVLGTTTADVFGMWSITTVTLAPGAHTLTAQALGVNGNSGASDPIKITVAAGGGASVPEFPSQLGFSLLMGLALLGVAVVRRRRGREGDASESMAAPAVASQPRSSRSASGLAGPHLLVRPPR